MPRHTFTYNTHGLRTTMVTPDGTTVFHYDLNGQLIAETTETGSLIRIYIWAEDIPIAQKDTALTYLHVDHLNTPRVGTNTSGVIVWQWDSDVFGSTTPNEDPDGDGIATHVNLRFPGQYYVRKRDFTITIPEITPQALVVILRLILLGLKVD
ncbi:YD repeat-containing protein [Nitrosomonas communis]|uniref:YD repeat-containing protein n=1 Tax=Nitrosomonas communis TaxID=44574 RepID=A0A1I4KZL3_9PROT|nr:hypothetical protein [Nitrosomonas communis]SFL83837.1 YD repeat-containing protein [Nitrosomonas communis]